MTKMFSNSDGYKSVANHPELVQYSYLDELQAPVSIQFALLEQAEISNRTLMSIKSAIRFLAGSIFGMWIVIVITFQMW